MIRTALTMVTLLVMTILLGSLVLLARLFGLPDRKGGLYERAPIWWTRSLLWSSGVKVVAHGLEHGSDDARVYIANHVSWFDIPCMIAVLPHFGFVAKREIERVPLFGPAARAVGVIYIDRDNRKAAFEAYEDAAREIKGGRSVIVYPEGTRGDNYQVRPFKKGPFVLAIQSGAPIVPVVVYGTIEVNPRGAFTVTPGTVHVHLLEPIPTEGLSYDDRDRIARLVQERIATTLQDTYGVVNAGPRLNSRGGALREQHAPA